MNFILLGHPSLEDPSCLQWQGVEPWASLLKRGQDTYHLPQGGWRDDARPRACKTSPGKHTAGTKCYSKEHLFEMWFLFYSCMILPTMVFTLRNNGMCSELCQGVHPMHRPQNLGRWLPSLPSTPALASGMAPGAPTGPMASPSWPPP